jgi:hypothetical protein
VGCGRFRTDPSYLPEFRGYLVSLLQARERIRSALDLDEWARTEAMPSDEEITRLRQLIRRPRTTSAAGSAKLTAARSRRPSMPSERIRRAVQLGGSAIRPLLEEGLA